MNEFGMDEVLGVLDYAAEDIAYVLGSLAHEKRLRVLRLLVVDRREFSDMQEATSLSKTALVHHLNKLVEAGVVNHVERGLYEISPDGRSLLSSIIKTYMDSARRSSMQARDEGKYFERLHSVQIVELPSMRVASFHAISKTPEMDALAKLRSWAEPLGLLDNLENHPVFGFNNPNPIQGKEEYGYEFWIRVGSSIDTADEVTLKDIEGGLYAVTTCRLKEEMESDFFAEYGFLQSWKKLKNWVLNSPDYELEKRPCLERSHDPLASEENLILDLYIPIRERS